MPLINQMPLKNRYKRENKMNEIILMINGEMKMNKMIGDFEKITLMLRDGELVNIKREIDEKPL